MHATGIIAEYNPFHNGHAYQAAEARRLSESDIVIAVMSGHFTQRGEIALLDKWSRAASAVASGVDLVFELPAVFAVRSAEGFASGGVRLLASLGIVKYLSFGVETCQSHQLTNAAAGLENPGVISSLKQNMKTGKPYAAALTEALAGYDHFSSDFIAQPNNILGVEYLRALRRYAPNMDSLPVRRIRSDYHSTSMTGGISSATAIRRQLAADLSLSPATASSLPASAKILLAKLIAEGKAPTDSSRIDSYLLAKLRFMSLNELQTLPECTEGLENRLVRTAQQSGTLACLLENLKTRRYPYSRLQRLLAHVLLGTTKNLLADFDQSGPLYARVLAANRQGRSALRTITRNSAIPVITKTTAFLNSQKLRSQSLSPLQTMLMFDIRATDIFSLCLPAPAARIGGLDFLTSATFANNF